MLPYLVVNFSEFFGVFDISDKFYFYLVSYQSYKTNKQRMRRTSSDIEIFCTIIETDLGPGLGLVTSAESESIRNRQVIYVI